VAAAIGRSGIDQMELQPAQLVVSEDGSEVL
jgi:hypothetical protein